MAHRAETRKPEALPATPLEGMMRDHLEALAVQNYSTYAVRNRPVHSGIRGSTSTQRTAFFGSVFVVHAGRTLT